MRLLTPGPVPVPPQILKSFSEPVIHHRTPQFEQILAQVFKQLRQVFNTEQPVCVITGTGSAAMEAAIVNTLSPGDEALVVVSGKFGERWADMCEVYGVITHRFQVPWGEKLNINAFKAELEKHTQLQAVLTQVCETSTATLHPVQEMAAACKAQHPEALFMADAITAMGCLNLPMDQWGLDVVVAGSQKAFMLPTGLSFVALSPKAWTAAKESRLPKYYLDLQSEKKANEKGQTGFSTPTPLIKALHLILDKMNEKGISAIQSRCELLAEITRQYAAQLGFETFSKNPSPSVTALKIPEGISGEKFRDWLESDKQIVVMGGQDQLKGKVIRIGHMGDISNQDMLAFFAALAEGADHWLKTTKYLPIWQKLSSQVELELKKVDKLF